MHSKPLVKCTQSNQEMAKWRIRKVKAEGEFNIFHAQMFAGAIKVRGSCIFIINRQRDVLIINRQQRFVLSFSARVSKKAAGRKQQSPRGRLLMMYVLHRRQ